MAFFNIDPPYVVKGSRLSTNYFEEADHRNLAAVIAEQLRDSPWIITYDDSELIRDIYNQYLQRTPDNWLEQNRGKGISD